MTDTTATLNAKIDKIFEKQKEAKRWDVVLAVIVAALSLVGFKVQSTIQEHIDESARKVTTRLAITQQFYIRKLSTYEEVHQQIANLANSLNDARFNSGAKKSAMDSLNNLYLVYTRNSLYLSNDLIALLKALVDRGNRLPSLYPSGTTSLKDITATVVDIEEQMKKDLHVEELGRIPGLEEK